MVDERAFANSCATKDENYGSRKSRWGLSVSHVEMLAAQCLSCIAIETFGGDEDEFIADSFEVESEIRMPIWNIKFKSSKHDFL